MADAGSDDLQRGGLVLGTLILGASVANLNLAVANVALPTIGEDLHASQSDLNFVAVGFTLGLAASVLYLGALADRYGRKKMLLAGLALSVPAAAVAAWAPDVKVLIAARVLGGVAAGMAFPTTLSLITALFTGAKRTSAIALWSGIGGGASAIGPVIVGALLGHFWWGSAFVITIPLAALALGLALWLVPRHAGEDPAAVDHLGGVLSVLLIGGLVLAINFVVEPDAGTKALVCTIVAVVALVLFVLRERRAPNPLFDLSVARRRLFWVAALAGMIVFGSLMGAMFIGQQFLQDVLSYSSFKAGLAILPAAAMMIVVSPLAARVIGARGARTALALGFLATGAGFAVMLTWKEGASYWPVGIAYALIGIGVALAGAPASRSIMASVPVRRAGMGSATNDLQRDLGGAIMQSILGALLTVRYAHYFTDAFASLPPSQASKVSDEAAASIKGSFGGAVQVAQQYPQGDSEQLVTAAKHAFTSGSDLAIAAAVLLTAVGLGLVLWRFPRQREELALESTYHEEDT
jgi:MFS transporter, DHA2 family, multidrug resistance protein